MKKLKYQKVCDAIRTQIAEGFWESGSRIYSERQLADLYDISRPTVKHALSDLIQEGLLEYKKGRKGMFVSVNNNKKNTPEDKPNERFIGVAIDNHTPAFASHLLEGIHEALWNNGFHTVYCNTYHSNEKVFERINSLINTSVAGVIYSPVLGPGQYETNKLIIDTLNINKIPFVLVDRYIDNHLDNHVAINNQEIFYEMVSKLIEQGHTRMLFLKGFEATSCISRLKGSYKAFEDAEIDSSGFLEIEVDEQNFYNTGRVSEEIITKVAQLEDFTVLIGLNQQLLEAGLQIVKKLNKNVVTATIISDLRENKTDIAIIQPIYRMGYEAAKLLTEIINNETLPVTQLTLKARILGKS